MTITRDFMTLGLSVSLSLSLSLSHPCERMTRTHPPTGANRGTLESCSARTPTTKLKEISSCRLIGLEKDFSKVKVFYKEGIIRNGMFMQYCAILIEPEILVCPILV